MNNCDTKAASEASQAVWERKRARIKRDMEMATEVLRGEFRSVDLDLLTGRVKVDGEHHYVYFADTPEMRAIAPGLLGRGEVVFYAKPHDIHGYHIVAIKPDNNQTGASE